MNRFETALFMQAGACNPSGIIVALSAAKDELNLERRDNPDLSFRTDPAIRLIVHQLSYIMGMTGPDFPQAEHGTDGWEDAMMQCCLQASENVIRTTDNEDMLRRARARRLNQRSEENADQTETR
jgi:hypothetical protein